MKLRKPSEEVRVGAKTHTGLVREENQDTMTRFFCAYGEVILVADGMGGHKGGRLAAELVAQGFGECLSALEPATSLEASLQEVTRRVNEEIREKARAGGPETAKMGSTLVLAITQGNRVTVAHVGDSRAYLLRGDSLTRLTKDHSRIQKMVDHGLLTEEQAREHPDANILNRSMGTQDKVEIEISPAVPLKRGDLVLLCSDGLHGYVPDERIRQACLAKTEAQATADMLVGYALEAGGEDNVTVQVLQFGSRKPRTYRPQKPPSPRKRSWWLPLAGLGLAAAGVGAWLLLSRGAKATAAPAPAGAEAVSTEKGAANVTSTEKATPKTPAAPAKRKGAVEVKGPIPVAPKEGTAKPGPGSAARPPAPPPAAPAPGSPAIVPEPKPAPVLSEPVKPAPADTPQAKDTQKPEPPPTTKPPTAHND